MTRADPRARALFVATVYLFILAVPPRRVESYKVMGNRRRVEAAMGRQSVTAPADSSIPSQPTARASGIVQFSRKNTCRDVLLPANRTGEGWKRILIILRGISYSSTYRTGANMYNRTYENFFSHMVQPWRGQGHSVDVALATYTSERIDHVVQVYSPAFQVVHRQKWSPGSRRTKIHSFLEGLQEAEKEGGASRWDFIVVTRFDIRLRKPISEFWVDFDKLNWPWTEKNNVEPWEELPRVGDAIHMFNSKYLSAMIDAAKRMLAKQRSNQRDGSFNNCHRILLHLIQLGIDRDRETHFLLGDICASRHSRGNPIYLEMTGFASYPNAPRQRSAADRLRRSEWKRKRRTKLKEPLPGGHGQ